MGGIGIGIGLELSLTSRPRAEGQAGVTPELLYLHHRQRIFQLCLRLGAGDRAWAEDATHDVFIKLLERLPGLDRAEDLGGWIYRVTVNTCMTRLKRDGSVWRRVARALSAAPPPSVESPEHELQVRQDLAAALSALDELPGKERVVFCMRYLDELPQQQIAATLGLSEGYVSKLLGRVRLRLQQQGWEVPRA